MFRSRTQDKLALWFFGQPTLTFALEFLALAPLILAADPSKVATGYLFLLPWLVLFFALINLPFVSAAFHLFRMDDATKRNHALEHATIHYLRQSGGRRLSGSAARNGFRVSGGSSDAVKQAFEQVRRVVRDGGKLPYVSRRCGSNIVTALGLGLTLLFIVALGSVLLQPPPLVRALALGSVVLLFVGMRHGIGGAIQRRFFMRVDFEDVALRDIRRIQAEPLEREPVHFVETIIRPKG